LSGDGTPPDKVLAYAWANLAASGRTGTEWAANSRRRIESTLTSDELAEAQRLSSAWKEGNSLVRDVVTDTKTKSVNSGNLAKSSTGTLFVVSKTGHAITNQHVINGCSELRIKGREGVAKLVTDDKANDLALLQIQGPVADFASIASDPSKLRQGEDVLVFGFPLNAVLSSSVNLTPGIVSALTGFGNDTNQIQITAPIQPGSSGSPVMNKKGNLVGVVAMKLSDTKMAQATGQVGQNVNFAVSGQTLRTFLDTHKVSYRNSNLFSFDLSTSDLADKARKWTMVVECWK
jgi:S1-C subfamily serine protease